MSFGKRPRGLLAEIGKKSGAYGFIPVFTPFLSPVFAGNWIFLVVGLEKRGIVIFARDFFFYA